MSRTVLDNYLKNIESEFTKIPEERNENLRQLGDYVISGLKEYGQAQLVFICTHNSRRSQFGELWALTAAQFYSIQSIHTFSGGTESTKFNPRAVAAITRAGFQVKKNEGHMDNPHFLFARGKIFQSNLMFSKKYNDEANPDKLFCAIMVCSDADEACPIITGADYRISIPYKDPKAFDNTDQEEINYDDCSRQIAREMFYTFRYVKTS